LKENQRFPLFKDIICLDNEISELKTIIEMLHEPERFESYGAGCPRGVLMHGEPGNGKTLMARALANEMGIPFHVLTMEDAVNHDDEAKLLKNIRSVFKAASEDVPAVIFIDELDSFLGCTGFSEENKAVSNQLMTLMDGFHQNEQIIIIAATNRLNLIPESLLRPGRFDKKLSFDKPEQSTRILALKRFTTNIDFESEAVLERVASIIGGMSMAEIKHIANEVLIGLAKQDDRTARESHFTDAADRYYLGLAKNKGNIDTAEKRRIAIHEIGHALIHYVLSNTDDFVRISIAPHHHTLGHFRAISADIRKNMTKTDIINDICTALGGYSAEIVFYGESSSGTKSDLVRATELATKMTERLGMSNLGPRRYRSRHNYIMETISDKHQERIDDTITKIVEDCHKKATDIIESNRSLIESITDILVEKTMLSKQEFEDILHQYDFSNDHDDSMKQGKNISFAAE